MISGTCLSSSCFILILGYLDNLSVIISGGVWSVIHTYWRIVVLFVFIFNSNLRICHCCSAQLYPGFAASLNHSCWQAPWAGSLCLCLCCIHHISSRPREVKECGIATGPIKGCDCAGWSAHLDPGNELPTINRAYQCEGSLAAWGGCCCYSRGLTGSLSWMLLLFHSKRHKKVSSMQRFVSAV